MDILGGGAILRWGDLPFVAEFRKVQDVEGFGEAVLLKALFH
jgi:hypothetical protein